MKSVSGAFERFLSGSKQKNGGKKLPVFLGDCEQELSTTRIIRRDSGLTGLFTEIADNGGGEGRHDPYDSPEGRGFRLKNGDGGET